MCILAEGLLMGTIIECPKHNGRFDVRSGAVKGAPVCVKLTTYPVKVEGGRIWLQIRRHRLQNAVLCRSAAISVPSSR